MRYLSVCSGIEAATEAWHELGWQPEAFSEIEPFPCAVLKHHYPEVPNFGDMTKFKEWNIGPIDLLVGGTPCQSFSVAGLREGLADPRGDLMLTFLAIARRHRPRWLVWENVPGVLSSNGGEDFACLLRGLAELGYGWSYRVLDAQHFGVAQRRRRVFVVGYLGDWHPAAAVLFERQSLRRDNPPSRQKGQAVAPTVVSGPPFSRTGNERVECEAIVAMSSGQAGAEIRSDGGAPTLTCLHEAPVIALAENTIGRKPQNGGNGDGFTEGGPMYTLNATGVHGVAQPMVLMDQGGSVMNVEYDMVGTLRRETHGHEPVVMQPIPFGVNEGQDIGHCLRSGASKADKHESTTYVAQPIAFQSVDFGGDASTDLSPTLRRHDPMAVMQPQGVAVDVYNQAIDGQTAATLTEACGGTNTSGPKVMQSMAVRRLTPVECERLQGFPDDYTAIPWRGKEAPDGPRYKALGNSMAVPVMRWIGKRIQQVEKILDER